MSQQFRLGSARPRKTLAVLALIALSVGGWALQPALAQDDSPFDIDRADSETQVSVSEYMTVELHVQDEELSSVLQLLSLQSQRNIVVSNDVSATVTADLYGVTFYEAMDAILHVNGYGYIEQGNFLFVYTLDEIAQIEAANRTAITKLIRLNYLNATDAASFVEPLLSEIGQIRTNGAVDTFTIPDDSPIGDESFALSATMVVTDYPEHVEEIERLILELDTRPRQVLVEATILQTQLNEANAFGVDFSIIGNVDFNEFLNVGGPLGVANALQAGGDGTTMGLSPADNNGFTVGSTPGGTSGASTLKLGVVQDDFSIFMRLLDEVTDFTVLSNPKILALNRQPARVLVGRRLGYLNSTATSTATTQTVQFLDTGTQLRFRPFISKDGMIRMELNPSVSEGFIRESVDATGAAVSIPDEVTQELTTNVIVRDGSTIVLGGLFKETTTLTRKQVPILGDIPLVGAAFRGHDDNIDRSEIIFLITPTIVSDALLSEQGDRASDYVEHVRTGSRQGLLPFSRDKMTAQLNVEAERLATEGDVDGALWRLRRSLELNPMQPDAVHLRERLVNERDRWPDRSLMESIVMDYGVGKLRRQAEALAARGASGDWIDPGESGPLPNEDPFILNEDAIKSEKVNWGAQELINELDSTRSKFAPVIEETDSPQAFVDDDPEGERLNEFETSAEFAAVPMEIESDRDFDQTASPGAAQDALIEIADAESEAMFGPNIVEFFNGEPGFNASEDPSFDDAGRIPGEVASASPEPLPSPFFITFDSLWTPFGAWNLSPEFVRGAGFDEMGLPVIAEADEEPQSEVVESVLEPGSMEESAYSTLTNLLDEMFENPVVERPDSDTEIAEVDTEGDGIDQ